MARNPADYAVLGAKKIVVPAFLGILLASLSVRTAVTALSPIAEEVGKDIELTSVGMGVIGALPLAAFALGGALTPYLLRRGTLELGIILATATLLVGQAGRMASSSYLEFFVASVFSFVAIGIMTALIPPLIKRYFAARQALVTGVYAAGLSVSLMAPATFSPIWVESLGWRGVMLVWAIAGAFTIFPWLVVVRNRNGAESRFNLESPIGSRGSQHVKLAWALKSRSAWLLSLALAITALNAFVTFAWLPTILRDLISMPNTEAGFLLGTFALWGFPLAVTVPWALRKWNKPGIMMQIGSGLFVLSYLGLIIAPGFAPWLWVTMSGIGTLIFPLVLGLVNRWSLSERGSILLTSFMQAAGYTLAFSWPVIVGLVHDWTETWTVSLFLLLGTGILGLFVGHQMHTWHSIEDEVPDLSSEAQCLT